MPKLIEVNFKNYIRAEAINRGIIPKVSLEVAELSALGAFGAELTWAHLEHAMLLLKEGVLVPGENVLDQLP